jgi:hypothetical protein
MLARKNLMVDASKVKKLAAKLKTSESEAVRHAVDTVLLETEVFEAVARLRKRGTLQDAYHRVRKSAR